MSFPSHSDRKIQYNSNISLSAWWITSLIAHPHTSPVPMNERVVARREAPSARVGGPGRCRQRRKLTALRLVQGGVSPKQRQKTKQKQKEKQGTPRTKGRRRSVMTLSCCARDKILSIGRVFTNHKTLYFCSRICNLFVGSETDYI